MRFGPMVSIASYASEPPIRLLAIYGSDMLFQQGEPARLVGFAPAGTALHAELYLDDTLLAQADALSGADGMFALELSGQPGSYDEYRIVLSSGGQPVAALERVVFGELWLAGGQSNMAWQYAIAPEGIAEIKAGYVPERPWIRMLPTLYEYVEDRKPPLLPQEDIPGAQWFRGDTEAAYGFSAVAWYFACDCRMPLMCPWACWT
jgi:sialate O-acetylesterase